MLSLLPILLVLLTGCLGTPERFKRALNGTKTVYMEVIDGVVKEHPYGIDYPYMIEVLARFRHVCGGALIKPSFAVTGRHCGPGNLNNSKEVTAYELLAGNQKYKDRTSEFVQIRQVEKIAYPEVDRWFTDVAVVKVTKPFDLNLHVNIIKLAPQSTNINDYLNEKVIQLGWGAKEKWRNSEYLLRIRGSVSNTCGLPVSLLCIRGLEGGKPRPGDSGGPVVIQGKNRSLDLLIGVHHGSHPTNKWYAIKLACFADWINETITKMLA